MDLRNLIIIGSGPAGLTAAMYSARAQLNPLVFEGELPGGQLMRTTYIDNWPGAQHVRGPQLMSDMKAQVHSFGAKLVRETIKKVDFLTTPFTIWSSKSTYQSRCIIVATGATPKRLGCPGEEDYWGKGVSTCAVCDGALYQNKRVLIVGGGDTALEDASFMTNFTDQITIVHVLDTLTASLAMQQRIQKYPSIQTKYQSTVTKIEGNGTQVTHAVIANNVTGTQEQLPIDAIFLAIGLRPNTKLFQDQLELDASGYIVQKGASLTSIPGIFAAGDVADNHYRQAITAAGSGCMAALDAERFLHKLLDKK